MADVNQIIRVQLVNIFLSNMQCFVGTQKNRLNETLVFGYSNAFFVRLGPSVRLEENNYVLIQYYFQPNSF